ncbi:MAG TPA: flippase [Candidatus Brocadiia bacterium]|nr:flippase [Candidatus Brocadiales bacterium]
MNLNKLRTYKTDTQYSFEGFNKKAIYKNSVILFIANAGTAVTAFVFAVIIGRFLGKESLGEYAFVISVLFFFLGGTELALSLQLTRRISQEPGATNRYLLGTSIFKLILGLISALLLFLLSNFFFYRQWNVSFCLEIGAVYVIFQSLNLSLNAVFRSFQRMDLILYLSIVEMFLQLSVGVICGAMGYSVVCFILILIVVQFLKLAGGGSLYFKYFLNIGGRFDVDLNFLRILWKESLPFAVTAVVGVIYFKLDVVLLYYISGKGEAGLYSAITRLIESAKMFPMAYVGTLYPLMAAAVAYHSSPVARDPSLGTRFTSDKQQATSDCLRHIFAHSARNLLLFALTASAIFYVFSDMLVNITFGSNFSASIPMLKYFSWILIPTVINGLGGTYLFSLGYEGRVARIIVGGILLNVLTNLILIPIYGAYGAIIALYFSETAIAIFYLLSIKETGLIGVQIEH